MYNNSIYYLLGNILNKKNIKYFIFKGSYKLEKPFSGDGDLDLFVSSIDAGELISIAEKIGFILLENTPIFNENFMKDLFYYDSKQDKKFHLQIHTQLNFGNRIASDLNLNLEIFLLKNRIKSEEFNLYILPPELDLILLKYRKHYQYGKSWYKRESFREQLVKIQTEHKKKNNNLDYLKEAFNNEECLFIQNLLLNREKISSKLNLKKKPILFKYRRFVNRVFILRVFYKVFYKITKHSLVGKRRIPFAGKVVVLVGIDGSGKSSSMNHLVNIFSKIVDVEKITLGSGQSGASLIRRIIFYIFGTNAFLNGHKGTRNSENRKDNKKRISFVYALWIYLCTRDKRSNISKMHKAFLKGKLIFVDRWIQEIDLNFADAPRLNRYREEKGFVGYVARFEQFYFDQIKLFKPDQIILLNITPETSVIRKPKDLTLEQAKRSALNMINFPWINIGKVKIIDANVSHEKVLKEISKSVWNVLKSNK